ncbi:MAG TPA: SRPBCC domain-containing protein [Candidatus Levybacteria bacterium]|nr:SRPBCC domain-containing protein [Candidatus Levybacteria bacterium]
MKTTFTTDKEKLQTTMERTFDASRDVLWKAHTDTNLMSKWWGPKDYEVIVEKYDPRPGGSWRIIHKGKDQNGQEAEYAFYGDFVEVQEPDHITWTFNFEPIGPGHEITETISFTDLGDGKAKLTTTSQYKSLADLEGMLQSGMEDGADQTWERLDELAKSM